MNSLEFYIQPRKINNLADLRASLLPMHFTTERQLYSALNLHKKDIPCGVTLVSVWCAMKDNQYTVSELDSLALHLVSALGDFPAVWFHTESDRIKCDPAQLFFCINLTEYACDISAEDSRQYSMMVGEKFRAALMEFDKETSEKKAPDCG